MSRTAVIIRVFSDKNEAKIFAISDNLSRRHLTTGQRAYLGYQYQQLIAVRAGGLPKGGISSNLKKSDSWGAAAKKAGVSDGSLSAMKTIVESGDRKLLQSVIDGEKTIHAAVHVIRVREQYTCVRIP